MELQIAFFRAPLGIGRAGLLLAGNPVGDVGGPDRPLGDFAVQYRQEAVEHIGILPW